ncbi:hypothetical protein PACTADRAFT_45974 [Pachysolen tannophilus NRRL Y-2460]|uniref:Glycylpeptide N-tetradecanoyltransferase n=1 Tax=Pachysolen tannophilus NRRL Y-2460 TaxID=669874 RepID=A0A1E4TPI7_PACTA|nr:hypothetical protein PACTADRAFT_45974 [Pachysolen tannophilus NRRL Y-2460]
MSSADKSGGSKNGSKSGSGSSSNSGSNSDKKSKNIEDLLKLLSMSQELTEVQKKEMEDYKFWKTQPVPKFDEKIIKEGAIDSDKTPDDIPNEPLPLLKDFEWCEVDLDSKEEIDDLFTLLHENYVEHQDATFRFNYPPEFFQWALKPPGWLRQWNVGVRVRTTGKLVAFISAIPTNLKIRGKSIKSVEINFLCIHKKLRTKRLAPVLIKEITRRVNKENIWQAMYTAGVVLPSPISVCRYNHRPINWSKLYDVGFSHLPENITKTQMISKYILPSNTIIEGLRKIKFQDIEQVSKLFADYNKNFELVQDFSIEELKHWLIGDEKVIQTYVVENPITKKITDFFSFYLLPFTVLNNPLHKELGIAYLFYYASDCCLDKPRFDPEATKLLSKRLKSLINDALIISKNLKIDVFNALTSQDNNLFLEPLKFGPGDGFLNFYLFNYRSKKINGGMKEDTREWDIENRSNVGIVML